MSTDSTAILDALKTLQSNQDKLATRLDDLAKPKDDTARSGAGPLNGGPPNVRKGENTMTSRGYSFLRAFGVMAGVLKPEQCSVEVGLSRNLQKSLDSHGFIKGLTNSLLLPFSSQLMSQNHGDEDLAREVGQVVRAGMDGYDADEYRRNMSNIPGLRQRALSWVDEATGGVLVAPPMQGELIDVFRNNEVLIQAGAQVLGMPPNGRIIFPAQKSASTAYWIGENTAITESTPGTGDVVLSAKKLGILTKIPNELFRFASVSIEMFIRQDMARVMALKMDKSLLEAVGSTVEPKGIINYTNITTHVATTTGANGDTFQPEDIAKMVGKVESQNAYFKAFIMRPLMWAALVNRRADAITAADAKGPFMFNVWRELGDNMMLDRLNPAVLSGYPALKSTQTSNARVKGSGTTLTYILGGDFTDYMIAMSGVVEFQVSTQGDTVFAADQTAFRGILYCDGAPRHEASFVLCDSLLES